MLRHSPRVYAFGPYRLDPDEKVLLNDGAPVPLTPKSLDTLLILVSRHGHLVGKDELIRTVWPDTVVEENNLTQNISALRRALGDADGHRFIETVPRRGYRFVAEVAEVPIGKEAGQEIDEPVPVRDDAAVPETAGAPRPMVARRFQLSRGVLAGLAGVGLVGALVVYVQRLRQDAAGDRFARPRIERLTDIGRATAVAISRQGDYIAYALGEPGQQELWIKHLATASTTLIVARDAVLYWSITFSPDGHYVYYVVWRHNEASGSLYRVPLLGGTPQRVFQESGTSVSFSPDGRLFAFTAGYTEGSIRRESRLMIAGADGTDTRALITRPDAQRFSESGGPAWSPDGTLIACGVTIAGPQSAEQRLITVRVDDAEQRTLSQRGWTAIGGVAWLPDGSGLLLTAKEDYFSSWRIWHVAYPSGIARIVIDDPNEYKSLMPTGGSGFVAVQKGIASGIWVWPAERPELARRISSEVGEYGFTEGLSWTPDAKLLCRSKASGNWDIWMMNADGTGSRQLTFDPHTDFHPAVFADGRSLAFVSNRGGHLNIWRMSLDGSDVRRLTDGDDEVRPQGSPDGRWVVYQKAFGEGRPTIWRVPIEGGAAVQLSERHALRPVISPDGRSIGYFNLDEQKWSIEVIPMEGGEPIGRFDIPPTVRSRALHWTPGGRALVYVDDHDGPSNLWRLPIGGDPRRQLTNFRTDHIPFFAWSQDGKWLAAVRESETSDVVRVTFARRTKS